MKRTNDFAQHFEHKSFYSNFVHQMFQDLIIKKPLLNCSLHPNQQNMMPLLYIVCLWYSGPLPVMQTFPESCVKLGTPLDRTASTIVTLRRHSHSNSASCSHNTVRTLRLLLNEVAHDAIVEVVDRHPLDALLLVFGLLVLQSLLDEDLLQLFIPLQHSTGIEANANSTGIS